MIEVCKVTKLYGNNAAVKELSFTIDGPGVCGLLGANGAGKTTTMDILAGCAGATEGQAYIDGFDVERQPLAAKRRLSYLPEKAPLYGDMTPLEYLRFVARARGVRGGEAQRQINRALAAAELGELSERLLQSCSKDTRQRLGIAQALLGEPSTLLLDEPSSSLDPQQNAGIRELLTELGHTRTVLLSSHSLSELRAVCGRVLVIDRGRLVADDTPEGLERRLAAAATLRLTVRGGEEAVRRALSGVAVTAEFSAAPEGTVELSLSTGGVDVRETVFFALAEARLPILAMGTAHADMAEEYLALTGMEEAEHESGI